MQEYAGKSRGRKRRQEDPADMEQVYEYCVDKYVAALLIDFCVFSTRMMLEVREC